MPLSIRRAKARAAELRDMLEVGETWDCRDFERAFNFQKHWQELIRWAPKGLRADLVALGAQIAAESPTVKRVAQIHLQWDQPEVDQR
ncbi:hypothetical protein ABIE09_002363 [Lysobacter enzymogenes]|uniref:hypothetical protein n=1 Tax=Lysobacter enzymogenes TaxID=69 RepID=UPI00339AC117